MALQNFPLMFYESAFDLPSSHETNKNFRFLLPSKYRLPCNISNNISMFIITTNGT